MTTTIPLRLGSKGPAVRELQERLHLMADGIYGTITYETVRAFQKEHRLTADGIVGPKTRAVLDRFAPFAAQPSADRIVRPVDKFIIHCSATPEGRDVTVEEIRAWHLQRGFATIGYHYVIYADGSIHLGRPLSRIGAHCKGQNARSVGICYIGGLDANGNPKDTRTPAQRRALLQLLRSLRREWPKATIHGHNEFAAKACPCFDVRKDPELCAV